jgi:hypothetical protein
MVVWALTAGIGIYLLAVGITAQRTQQRTLPTPAKREATPAKCEPAPAKCEATPVKREAAPVKREAAVVVGSAALAMVLGDERPAAARPAPEGSPLLEFVHPALALVGLTFWIFYMMSHYRPFAWTGFGVVVATMAAGLSWEAVRRRTARRPAGSTRGNGTSFPPHLVILHGLAALCTFALVVITAVVAR